MRTKRGVSSFFRLSLQCLFTDGVKAYRILFTQIFRILLPNYYLYIQVITRLGMFSYYRRDCTTLIIIDAQQQARLVLRTFVLLAMDALILGVDYALLSVHRKRIGDSKRSAIVLNYSLSDEFRRRESHLSISIVWPVGLCN